ncbi:MAG: hypothetical protein QN168_11845 [Armatimonadota bacterium]|nr:hypothetical protein [Armatimonadota bacterium]
MAVGFCTRAAVVGALACLVAGPGRPASAAPPPPASLLQAMQARKASAFRGEQIVVTWENGGTHVTLGRIEHDPPGWVRLEYAPVGTSTRWIVVRQSGMEIQYDPATRVGTKSPRLVGDDGETVLATHLPWLLENYRVGAAPGLFLGRKVERIVMRPVRADRPARRIDVDQESGVVLRSERMEPGGRLVGMTAFQSFEVMPRGWRAGAGLPRDLRLVERPMARKVTPEEVVRQFGTIPVAIETPGGFHPVAYYLVQHRQPALQVVYSDGLSVLVVTMQRGILPRPPKGSRLVHGAAGPVWVRRFGQNALVHWAYNGWLLTMVGDVVPEQLIRAAELTGVARMPRVYDHIESWLKGLFGPF